MRKKYVLGVDYEKEDKVGNSFAESENKYIARNFRQ